MLVYLPDFSSGIEVSLLKCFSCCGARSGENRRRNEQVNTLEVVS